MWSCGFTSRHPVELVFHLPNIEYSSSESHGLSKITVWNYNRGIKVSRDRTQPLQALYVFVKQKRDLCDLLYLKAWMELSNPFFVEYNIKNVYISFNRN